MHHKVALLGLVAALASTAACADPSLHLASTIGLSLGGDNLATVEFTDGSTEKMNAGNSLYIAAGPSVEFNGTPWSVQALYGYATFTAAASNADIKFTHNTLDTMVFYRVRNSRFGVGIASAMSAELSQGAISATDSYGNYSYQPANNVKYGSTSGLELEYDYLPPRSHLGIDFRAASLQYQAKTVNGITIVNGQKYDGSFLAAGIYLYL